MMTGREGGLTMLRINLVISTDVSDTFSFDTSISSKTIKIIMLQKIYSLEISIIIDSKYW